MCNFNRRVFVNIAIVLAGGVGSRVGYDTPKQFIEILNKPILAYTIEKFQFHEEIDFIEVVCVRSHIEYLKKMVNTYSLTKVRWIVEGGATFQESVINGIENLSTICRENDLVSIHFGASPFVCNDIISDSIRVCKEKGNAISTTPFYLLSGIKTDEEKSLEYIDRDTIACMNSPHTFQFGFIKKIYDEARDTKIMDKIDHPHTTSLMYVLDYPIYFSKGSQTNIKITTVEDLELFEGYVLFQREKLSTNC